MDRYRPSGKRGDRLRAGAQARRLATSAALAGCIHPTYGTGAIVNVAKVVPMPKAAGKWNFYDITARGPRFTVVLDGKRTVNGAVDYKHASGWIALQYGKAVVDTGVVKFRKVQIRTL
ncbi:MAG TPA: family 16 glycoside hydrolase [Candidatus Sulfotelmatobacter sp.]|nr:family 16 glycoside hydrolase [Candidatus Sulfotelmatobacter sp.]